MVPGATGIACIANPARRTRTGDDSTFITACAVGAARIVRLAALVSYTTAQISMVPGRTGLTVGAGISRITRTDNHA